MSSNRTQPKPAAGKEFSAWGVSNWGHIHHAAFRTRKEAKAYCVDLCYAPEEGKTWDDVKEYMYVFRIKVTVL